MIKRSGLLVQVQADWDPLKCPRLEKLLFIPKENEIEQFIAGFEYVFQKDNIAYFRKRK